MPPLSLRRFEDDIADEKMKDGALHVETTTTAPLGISGEDAEFLANFSDDDRKAVLRKLDWRLVPFLAFLYLVSYIDRANIGNAKIEGMTEDLNMEDTDYNVAVSIFFIPYIIFELPANTILAWFERPSHFMGALTVSWGIVMTLTGIVQNYGGLIAARFMLGVCEAGFFPGAIFLVGRWYLPSETQFRIAIFYTSSAMAGAFSGLLAFAIAKMDGIAGVAGWRWIFILEGIASVLTGVACVFLLVDSPAHSTRWLTTDEIRYLELRQIVQHGNSLAAQEAEKNRKWQILRSVLLDWKIYTMGLVFWANTAPNYGLKFSMPQIIADMGFESADAQLLTIPPYTVGAISAMLSGLYSDRLTWRMPFICVPLVVVVVAYAILFSQSVDIANNIPQCYFALCLACAGLYPVTPGVSAWNINNISGPTARAQGSAFMNALGAIGGIIGSYMYLDRESPQYPTGYGLSFALAALGIVSALVMEFFFKKANRERDQMTETEIYEKYTEEQLGKMGHRSPFFRYTL